jgi:hypothetical protein
MALNFQTIKTIKGGSIVGTGWGVTAVPSTETTVTFGSSSSLWGSSWTYSDINASNFGISFDVFTIAANSNVLEVTNFGFSIPSGETIVGIQFDVVAKSTGAGTASAIISINYVSCTITTTITTYTSLGNFFQFL